MLGLGNNLISHREVGGGSFEKLMDLINLQSNNVANFTIVAPNKVSAWIDSNNSSTWTQGTDANRPLLSDGVIFDGANDTLIKAVEVSANDYSFYCVVRYLGTNTGAVANLSLFSANSATDWFGFQTNYNIGVNTSAASRRLAVAGYKGNRFIVLGVRKLGNTFTFTINDRVCLQTGAAAVATTLFGRLGSLVGFGFHPNINIKAFCLSSTVFNNTEHQSIVNSLYNLYSLGSLTSADNVCGFGDSNTTGQGATSYLVGLSTQMGLAHLNLGIAGTLFVNSTAAVNNGYDRYQAQIVTKPYTDYIVIQYGTNDILSFLPVGTFETQMNTMVGSLISQGYNPDRICMCSVPYQSSGANAAALNLYRTAIVNISTTHGTKYFDLLQAMRDGGGNSLLADAVHLNASGMTIWQNGVYTAFTS
jgi:lysophospholipase L1-like esterase